ncbi:MAG: hypothetical protein KJ787_13400 [Gammaproteobacteria bacterium]|nr:hypothetical protein [Gammaproteobacteria bacterium]MBU1647321.1 hypothetical protein [Gammaproteobacteria bacterium]MBU1973113.1 hypothetical protein [Gammaproteobacteria bacterium]
MTQQAASLIEILSPPGNRWLMELSRRKSDLPEGVRIVRFNDGDDDLLDDVAATQGKRRPKAAR